MAREISSLEVPIYVAAMILGVLVALAGAVVLFAPMVTKGPGEIYIPGIGWIILWFLGMGIGAWGERGLRRRKYGKATKKTRVADENAKIYEKPDSRSTVVAAPKPGDDIELSKYTEVNGVDWEQVKLPDGREGFFMGKTYTTVQAAIKAHAVPIFKNYDGSELLTEISAGTELEVESIVLDDPNDAVPVFRRVCLSDGRHGFMKSTARFRQL